MELFLFIIIALPLALYYFVIILSDKYSSKSGATSDEEQISAEEKQSAPEEVGNEDKGSGQKWWYAVGVIWGLLLLLCFVESIHYLSYVNRIDFTDIENDVMIFGKIPKDFTIFGKLPVVITLSVLGTAATTVCAIASYKKYSIIGVLITLAINFVFLLLCCLWIDGVTRFYDYDFCPRLRIEDRMVWWWVYVTITAFSLCCIGKLLRKKMYLWAVLVFLATAILSIPIGLFSILMINILFHV